MHLGFYEEVGMKVSMLVPDDTWSGDPFTKVTSWPISARYFVHFV